MRSGAELYSFMTLKFVYACTASDGCVCIPFSNPADANECYARIVAECVLHDVVLRVEGSDVIAEWLEGVG